MVEEGLTSCAPVADWADWQAAVLEASQDALRYPAERRMGVTVYMVP